MNCSEEFGLFLTASPNYFEIPAPEPGFELPYQQIFICSDGGIRWYQEAQPSRLQVFQNYLTTYPQFKGLTPASIPIIFGTNYTSITDVIPINDINAQFFLPNFIDDTEFYVAWNPALSTQQFIDDAYANGWVMVF